MRIVSPLLKHVIYPSMAKARLLSHMAEGLAVVTYHGILPQGYKSDNSELDGNLIDVATLRSQLRLLKARYQVIAPEDLLSYLRMGTTLPPRSVLLTCDDGLLNHFTEMLPVLQEEGLRCLFFVTGQSSSDETASLWYEELFLLMHHAPTGSFEISLPCFALRGALGPRESRHRLWWSSVKKLSQVSHQTRKEVLSALYDRLNAKSPLSGECLDRANERRFRLLRPGELLQLRAAGMTIGAHTMNHPVLAQCPIEIARSEIAESRSLLESVLDTEIWAFAYPFGTGESLTPYVVQLVKDAGFEAGFVNVRTATTKQIPKFRIPRVHVTAGMTLGEFEAHVAGFHDSLQRWARGPRHAAALRASG